MPKPWRDRASLGNPRIDTRPMWSLFLSGGRAHATYRRSWQSGRTRAARSASSDTVRSVGRGVAAMPGTAKSCRTKPDCASVSTSLLAATTDVPAPC
jgi:hypothetical protein